MKLIWIERGISTSMSFGVKKSIKLSCRNIEIHSLSFHFLFKALESNFRFVRLNVLI